MKVGTEIYERSSHLSAYETIQTIIAFGVFTISLIGLIVNLLKIDRKNNRLIFSRITVILT